MSKPAQSAWTKLVEPLALSWPAALAGPGVSRPMATMSVSGNFREVGGDFEAVFDLLEADFGALFGEGRMLAEAFDQKFFIARDQRVVDRRPAQIDSRNDFHVGLPNRTSPVLKRFKR